MAVDVLEGMSPQVRPSPSTRFTDLRNRSEWMKQKRIDLQILSPELRFVTPIRGTKEEQVWAKQVNDSVAVDIEGRKEFAALALVPLVDGESAASELERSVRILGLSGGMIHSRPEGGLSSPRLEPLWEAATDLDVPLVLHSLASTGDERLKEFDLDVRIGRSHDVGVAVAGLIFGRVLDKFEALKIVVVTGGGSLPFLLPRLDQDYRLNKEARSTDRFPSEYFCRLYFDSLVFGRGQFELLLEVTSADHVMLGTDWPVPLHEDDPRQFIVDAGGKRLCDEQLCRVLSGTANDLFSLHYRAHP